MTWTAYLSVATRRTYRHVPCRAGTVPYVGDVVLGGRNSECPVWDQYWDHGWWARGGPERGDGGPKVAPETPRGSAEVVLGGRNSECPLWDQQDG